MEIVPECHVFSCSGFSVLSDFFRFFGGIKSIHFCLVGAKFGIVDLNPGAGEGYFS